MITLYGSCRCIWGESREVQPLWLIGVFSALLAMRLGKFPNKLWYFLVEIPLCVIGLPIEPTRGLCCLHSLYQLYSLCRVCRTFRTCGCRSCTCPTLPTLILFFPFRSVGGGPRAYFAFVNGNDCSAFLCKRNKPRIIISTGLFVDMIICWLVDRSSRLPSAVGFPLREQRNKNCSFLFSPVRYPIQ